MNGDLRELEAFIYSFYSLAESLKVVHGEF